jgi:hypothetical protein
MQQTVVQHRGRRRFATFTTFTGRTGGAIACGALAVVLVGCSGSSPSSGSPGPSGSSAANRTPAVRMGPNVVDATDGIRLTLPAGWYRIPLGGTSFRTLNRLVHDPTQRSNITEQIQLGQSRGMRVFALQPQGKRRPNSLGLAVTGAAGSTLDSLQAQIKVASTQYAADTPRFDRIQVPAGQALRVHYRLLDGDSTTQYYLLAFTQAYVLTVTSSRGGASSVDLAVANAVARTLQLSPAA